MESVKSSIVEVQFYKRSFAGSGRSAFDLWLLNKWPPIASKEDKALMYQMAKKGLTLE